MNSEESFNTQEYLNSLLKDSAIEELADSNPNGLFNDRPPNLAILHEKPEHRLAIMLKAKHGLSNREIARVLGYTDPWVSQLFRQPWAKERVLKEMNASGGDAITALLEAEAVNSLFTVIDIRDDPGAPKAVRGAMANSILDRFCGKPTQKIESEVTVRNAKDIEAVDRELEELKKEEARLCGNANN